MRKWMNMNRMSKNPNLYSLTPVVTFLMALTAVCGFAPAAALGQASSVVFSQANGVIGLGSSPTKIDYSGTAGHMAANSRGDLFIPVSSNGMDFLEEIPANGGSSAAVQLLGPSSTGASSTGNAQGVFVDSANNLYATYSVSGAPYSAAIVYIPFVNGGYATGTQFENLGNCSAFPVPATTTAPCNVPFSNYLPSSTGNYVQPADVALDGSGNLYILTKYVGGTYNSGKILAIKIPRPTPRPQPSCRSTACPTAVARRSRSTKRAMSSQ